MSTTPICLSCRIGQQSSRTFVQRYPLYQQTQRRFLHNRDPRSRKSTPRWNRRTLTLALTVAAGAALVSQPQLRTLYADTPTVPADVTRESIPKTGRLSKEDNRDSISSQHLQVKKSWENPGVYAWGSNSGKVVAPTSDEAFVKTPRRIDFFDGQLLRDLKLDRTIGVAITEKGDLLQWGEGFSKENREPSATLTGKDLVSVAISRDRVVALGSDGKVYSLPMSQKDQIEGSKPAESSWIPFWSSRSRISYRPISPKDLGWGEKVTSLSSGLESMLLLTSTGRVFSAASSSEEFPSRGEMGVPGLTWTTLPSGPYDQPHEITTLRGFNIIAVASGDYHSLVLDTEGRVFSFGQNTSGQLGFDPSSESPCIDAPSLIPISRLYSGTGLNPKVTSIAAGGSNSFFTIDAARVAKPGDDNSTSPSQPVGRITADTWASGAGILGTLGTGRWSHVQGTPAKIKSLSGLFEYDESNNTVVPIRLRSLSVGSTHAATVMDNVTHVQASASSGRNDTNWGADVLWWGGNEFYQLGLGRRNNVSTPTYIAPLDMVAEKGREGGKRREEHRFQITPRHTVQVGKRKVSMEQRVECGRMCSAVYSGV